MDLPEWAWLLRLARRAEKTSGMAGLASFLLAKANQASDGIPSMMHSGDLGAEVFRSLREDPTYREYFRENPWWTSEDDPERAARMEPRWTFLGGWFGLPPIMALATSDGAGRRHDPSYVFMPQFAVGYATDLVVRLAAGRQPRTWSEVWDRWARVLPTVVASPHAPRRGSLADFLARAGRRGADPTTAGRPVEVSRYPGFSRVVRDLQSSESRLLGMGWPPLQTTPR